MRVARLFTLFAAATAFSRAAPLSRNLGDGLTYVRVHTVPADLPTEETGGKQSCILDLRYAHAPGAAANLLGSWLKFHSSTRTPVFILVNGATAPTLLRVLGDADAMAGVLTIGVTGQQFHPDISVRESADNERRAYEALEKGSAVSTLTTDHPDKQRDDEASLARDRTPEASSSDVDAASVDGQPQVPADEPAAEKKVSPEDLALQRAIHLYRGLRAMKRL